MHLLDDRERFVPGGPDLPQLAQHDRDGPLQVPGVDQSMLTGQDVQDLPDERRHRLRDVAETAQCTRSVVVVHRVRPVFGYSREHAGPVRPRRDCRPEQVIPDPGDQVLVMLSHAPLLS